MIDAHVHLAALPDGNNGCFISPQMLKGSLVRMLARKWKLPLDRPSETNTLYVERLLKTLRASKSVRKAVLLAMDGVYTREGTLDRQRTHFLISNDYLFRIVQQTPDVFLPGVSINPERKDALDELERCAARGAVLVKVLPNSQQFYPSQEKYRPFWRAMARLQLPLLSHVGFEFSLRGKEHQSAGDPDRLSGALEEGVTVIAAHGASTGLVFFERHWRTLCEFVQRYEHFYWDASALSLPNRMGMLLRIRRHPELHRRMVFATDYPLPSFALPALLAGKLGLYWKLRAIDNPFDRHYELLKGLGFSVERPALNFSTV